MGRQPRASPAAPVLRPGPPRALTGQLAGRVTVVTGSTRGIGRAMAQRFAAEGATVVVHGRRREDAEQVAAAIPRAVAVAADLHDRAAAASLVDRVVDRVGRID